VAVLAVPFTGLGAVTGGRVWILFGTACFALGLLALSERSRRAQVVTAIGSAPTAVMVLNAQLDGLVVLGLGLAWLAFQAGSEWLAGAALGLTLFKPQLVLPLGLALLAGRRWRLLGGWAGAGIVLAGGSALIDRRWILDWLHAAGGPTGANLGLPGLAAAAGGSHLWLVLALAVAAAIFTVALAARAPSIGRQVGVVIAGGLLAAPHALGSDFTLLAPAVLVAGDGGFVLWLAISALSLGALYAHIDWLGALISVLLAVGVMARLAGVAGPGEILGKKK